MMNDLLRLFDNFDPKAIKVPHLQVAGSLDEQAFELRFADASSAMDEELFDVEPLPAMVIEQEKVDRLSSGLSFHSERSENAIQPLAQPVITGTNIVSVETQAEVMKSAKELQHSATTTDDFRDQSLRITLPGVTKFLDSGHADSHVRIAEPTIAGDPVRTFEDPSSKLLLPAAAKTFLGRRIDQVSAQETVQGLAALDDGASLSVRPADANNISIPSVQSVASFSATEIAGLSKKGARIGAATATPLDTLDIETGDQWIGRLGMEVSRLTGEKTTLSFQLKPNNLGKLQVEIISDGAGNIVRLETESETARQLIVGAQGRLEQDVRLGGSKLLRVDVTSQEQSQPQTNDHNADSQARRTAMEQREYGAPEGPFVEPVALPSFGSKVGSQFGERYA